MKSFFGAILGIALFLTACGGENTDGNTNKNAIHFDQTEIADALHSFFSWYGDNADRIGEIDFAVEKGGHLTLDNAKLQLYLAEFKKSGFVSDELIADEVKYYQACAKIWAKEPSNQSTVGLQLDRYLCDFENVSAYEKAPANASITGDRAKVVMTVAPNNTHTFDMKKENGKWYLAKPSCAEPSVQY
jgi:hypothetical protein